MAIHSYVKTSKRFFFKNSSGRIESEEVEPTMKKMKDLGERHLTDDNSFLCQTSKRIFKDISRRIRGVR